MNPTHDERQHHLAKLLWENGFGDDPWRNWRMAELMIIDDGFLSWGRQARILCEYESRGQTGEEAYQQALSDFQNGVAYWIYATSLGLSWPSHDPDINWRIAGALKNWLATVEL